MNIKNLVMWVIIVLLSVGLFNMFQDPNKISSERNSLAFSNFLNECKKPFLDFYQISKDVNKPTNNSISLIQKINDKV